MSFASRREREPFCLKSGWRYCPGIGCGSSCSDLGDCALATVLVKLELILEVAVYFGLDSIETLSFVGCLGVFGTWQMKILSNVLE